MTIKRLKKKKPNLTDSRTAIPPTEGSFFYKKSYRFPLVERPLPLPRPPLPPRLPRFASRICRSSAAAATTSSETRTYLIVFPRIYASLTAQNCSPSLQVRTPSVTFTFMYRSMLHSVPLYVSPFFNSINCFLLDICQIFGACSCLLLWHCSLQLTTADPCALLSNVNGSFRKRCRFQFVSLVSSLSHLSLFANHVPFS